MRFDRSGNVVTGTGGWRTSRANVSAREGRWYYEVNVLRGLPPNLPSNPTATSKHPHIRVGFSRREAPLDCPVGYDVFSYGLSDTRMEAMHRSRPHKYVPTSTDQSWSPPLQISTGDVIGLEISLPSISTHRTVVCGGKDEPQKNGTLSKARPYDVIRDRIPIPYRGLIYFESFEYQPTKSMESFNERTREPLASRPGGHEAPSPDHTDPSLRTLAQSSIRLWINGKLVGPIFENLLAFLPPASNVPPHPTPGVSARPGLDDGTLGYYPTISTFSGGIAELNLGPNFVCPPPDLTSLRSPEHCKQPFCGSFERRPEDNDLGHAPLRPFCDRFEEAIAEDVVWDIIDEVTFFIVDGGSLD